MQKIMIKISQTIQGTKFSISKAWNPNTNKDSSTTTDFSFAVWGEVTADYLISARKLKKDQFQQIFDKALCSARSSGKYKHAINTAANERLKSHRAELYSESESSDDGGQENGRPGLDCDDVNKAIGSKKSGGSNQTAEFDWEDGYYTGYADPRYDEW
jgi:hypothetical protein